MAKKDATKSAKKTSKPVAKAKTPAKTAKPVTTSKKPSTTNKDPKKMPATKTSSTKATKETEKKAVKKAANIVIDGNYKPSDKEEYMSANQLEYFRQKLVKWKDELSTELKETLDNLKEENWQESDIADRATVETDASLELRTRDRYRKLINKINDALVRIDKGSYGYCEETGEEIGIKRLEARPIATLSIEAQERHERDERTHYDEDMEERQA